MLQTGLLTGVAFLMIGRLTWFFSSWPRTFIRTFCPPGEIYKMARPILRDEARHRRGMRGMVFLQMGAGIAVLLIALGAWLIW